jgi:hypothetical protein
MKTIFAFFLAALATSAYGYTDSLKLSCVATQSFIAENGTVVLATGNYFAEITPIACMSGVPAFVRTRDVRFCWVGYYCHGRHSQGVYTQGTNEACRDGSIVAVSEEIGGSYAPVIMICDHGRWLPE